MIITLTNSERDFCNYVAVLRNESNRRVTAENPVVKSGVEPEYAEREGVMSELAFCKLMNVFPAEFFDVSPRSATKGEDAGDVTINDHVIDVKTTKYKAGKLLSKRKNPAIDIVVLMIGENGSYRLKGGMTASELYEDWRYNRFKMPTPCFAASQAELMSVQDVMSFISHTSLSKANPENAPAFDWSLP